MRLYYVNYCWVMQSLLGLPARTMTDPRGWRGSRFANRKFGLDQLQPAPTALGAKKNSRAAGSAFEPSHRMLIREAGGVTSLRMSAK